MECEGSIEPRFARFVLKLAEDSGKLGVHFLVINSIKFGGSLAYDNARGHRSMNKKSGLGDKLVNIVDQDVSQSSWHLGTTSLPLASGCSKTASVSQTTGSLWRKNGTLLATTRAVSLTMSLEDKMRQGSIVNQCNR